MSVGIAKRFNAQEGVGVIAPDDGAKDGFVLRQA
jgi:cold shock CspA family protein